MYKKCTTPGLKKDFAETWNNFPLSIFEDNTTTYQSYIYYYSASDVYFKSIAKNSVTI